MGIFITTNVEESDRRLLKEGKVNGLRVNDDLWYRPRPFAEFGCPCAVCRTRVVNNSIYCNGANFGAKEMQRA